MNKILLIFQLFHGVSALAGGLGLVLNPDGAALGMDPAILAASPFSDFLLPGIILFLINGLGNMIGAVITLKKTHYDFIVGILFGLIMMGWITFQVAWIGYQTLLQPVYFITGFLQFLTGLMVRFRNQL